MTNVATQSTSAAPYTIHLNAPPCPGCSRARRILALLYRRMARLQDWINEVS